MTIAEFAILVKEMRDCQKKYFRSRLRDALNQSKELEREVDQAIKEILNPQPQGSLF